jgi:RING finger protein 113A
MTFPSHLDQTALQQTPKTASHTLANLHRPLITLKMADPEPAAPVAVFKKRGAKSKANLRKRPATPPPASDSDSDAFSSSEDEAGHRIKRRKKTAPSAAVTASSRNDAAARHGVDEAIARETVFEADRASAAALDTARRDATKGAEWFDEPDGRLDAKGLLGSTRAIPPPPPPPDGTYKGLRNQTSYIQRNPDAPSRTVGPVKAPTNIRTITITDMAPDVCKDYKQTGFCGFGDVCPPLPYSTPTQTLTTPPRHRTANSSTRAKTTRTAGSSTRSGRT